MVFLFDLSSEFNLLWVNLCVFLCSYHLRDIVVGKIYFLLVRLKIICMELQLLKKEIGDSGTKRLFFSA